MHAIQVIATTDDGNRAAIETAALLSRASRIPVSVLVPRIGRFAPAADAAPDATDEIVAGYQHLIDQLGADAHIRVCACRGLDEMIERLTAPDMTLVVG